MLMTIDDWNAKAGNKAEWNVIGKFGLGVRMKQEISSLISIKPTTSIW